MKKIIHLLIVTCSITLTGFSQIVLKKVVLPGNKIEMDVPNGFLEMTPQMKEVKYPSGSNKPHWIAKDATGKVILEYSLTPIKMDDNGIPGYTDQLLAEMKAPGNDKTYIDDGIFLRDGKNIGYLKFITQVEGKKNFNFLFYLNVDNRLAVFNFTTLKKWRKKWENKVEEMANSIRLKAELK